MRIVKPLNNNVVIAAGSDKQEVVVMGSGVGFYAKKGDIIDESKIEKIFILKENRVLQDLISEIPMHYLELVVNILNEASERLDIEFSDKSFVMLTDHLYFAIDRIKEGHELENPFLIDIKQFYEREYKVALMAKEKIKTSLSVDVSEDEVGYIAMHIIEGGTNQNKKMAEVFEVIRICTDYLKQNVLFEYNESSLAYARLVNHIKHFAKRYVDKQVNKFEDQVLKKTIDDVFQEELQVVMGLSDVLNQKIR